MTESKLVKKAVILTIVFVDFVSLLLEIFELTLVTLEVAYGLSNKRLEFLQHNYTIYALLSWHLNRIYRDNIVVLHRNFLWCLRYKCPVLLGKLFA